MNKNFSITFALFFFIILTGRALLDQPPFSEYLIALIIYIPMAYVIGWIWGGPLKNGDINLTSWINRFW